MRKPALVAEGTKQELSHELEVVLIHREAQHSRSPEPKSALQWCVQVTGTGYFANVIVPVEVSWDLRRLQCGRHLCVLNVQGSEPGLDLLAPLVNQAELPAEAVRLTTVI